MALEKSELYSSLWRSCDELRGGMDASQYKEYVLVLLFVEYVSDKYAGQPFAPITIPPGASFADMVALKGKGIVSPGSYQYDPALASFADGSFVIVYRSDEQDGSGAGVFGQRFDAAGAMVGTEFKANTCTAGSQYEPDVAALTGGGFVVVWRSHGQDGGG